MPKKGQIWPTICFLGNILALPVPCWLVVVAWAVSRKTPIYFIYSIAILVTPYYISGYNITQMKVV